ncbi:hypothetical protein Tco_0836228 [Tanacetum coccineum]
MPYSHYPPTEIRLPSALRKYVFLGRNSNAIFALPGHGSTSFVGRKSNAIFALPGHGSTSSVGRKSNAVRLPSPVNKMQVKYTLGGRLLKSYYYKDLRVLRLPSAISRMPYSHYPATEGPPNKFTWYKNKTLHSRIAAYSNQTRPNLTFVSTSWRHPWDPTLGITLRKISAMANTTPIVTTVTKPATKEKTPKDADATPRVNIQDFCEEHYEDILPAIMDKIHRDKRKEVHARLDFEESPRKKRIREGSQNSSARTLSARYRNPSERLKVWERLRYNDRHVLERLGHRRQSAFGRLSDTNSPRTSKFGPDRANSGDRSHSRSRPHKQDSSNRDHPRSRDHSCGFKESYGNTRSSFGTGTKHGYRSHDRGLSHYEKKGRENKSPSSRVSESGTSDGVHWKSR